MLNLNHVLKERTGYYKKGFYISKQEEWIKDQPIKKYITRNKIHSPPATGDVLTFKGRNVICSI